MTDRNEPHPWVQVLDQLGKLIGDALRPLTDDEPHQRSDRPTDDRPAGDQWATIEERRRRAASPPVGLLVSTPDELQALPENTVIRSVPESPSQMLLVAVAVGEPGEDYRWSVNEVAHTQSTISMLGRSAAWRVLEAGTDRPA